MYDSSTYSLENKGLVTFFKKKVGERRKRSSRQKKKIGLNKSFFFGKRKIILVPPSAIFHPSFYVVKTALSIFCFGYKKKSKKLIGKKKERKKKGLEEGEKNTNCIIARKERLKKEI